MCYPFFKSRKHVALLKIVRSSILEFRICQILRRIPIFLLGLFAWLIVSVCPGWRWPQTSTPGAAGEFPGGAEGAEGGDRVQGSTGGRVGQRDVKIFYTFILVAYIVLKSGRVVKLTNKKDVEGELFKVWGKSPVRQDDSDLESEPDVKEAKEEKKKKKKSKKEKKKKKKSKKKKKKKSSSSSEDSSEEEWVEKDVLQVTHLVAIREGVNNN